MTLDEVTKRYTHNAEYERTHGSLQGCLEFRQLAEWLKELKQLREQQPCEEAISRQEAIKSIEEKAKRIKNGDTLNGLAGAVAILFDLPSVNPQPSGDLISRQTSFETPEQEPLEVEATKLQQAYNKGFEDCRQAVLDYFFRPYSNEESYSNIDIARIIKALPSVKPQEPKTGHWKAKSFHELYCDNCGFDFDIMRNDFIDKMKYCPDCGCRMFEPQESEDKE